MIGVGELARDYAPDRWAPDAEAAVPLAEAMLEPGDAILVKGSRSVGLELVADELIARRAAPR
jgi:UDP-N-acetylmuramyl pentapeptide synthase